MILQALTRYYDVLAADPGSGTPLYGYSVENVSFALNISSEGELLDVFPLFTLEERGKKTVEIPRRMELPARVKRTSGVAANFLSDNCAYVLGLADETKHDRSYADERFDAFRRYNVSLLARAGGDTAHAVAAFLTDHDPLSVRTNPVLAGHVEAMLKGGNLVFRLEGHPGFVHQDPAIRRMWEAIGQKENENTYAGQCLVTGEVTTIERLHPSIKGVRGANPTGASIVSFNERAYESYNRGGGQGLNSPVGAKATFAYTTALNALLSSRNRERRLVVGDATVVHWAESTDKVYENAIMALFEPEPSDPEEEETSHGFSRDARAESLLKAIADKVMRAKAIDLESLPEGMDVNTRCYVLGLAPNAARISVRFFHQDPFIKTATRIMAHHRDLEIVKAFPNQPSRISVRQMLNETVSRYASDKAASPLLAGAVFRAILGQTPYPAALYYAIINRVRADVDDRERRIEKINYVRAAVVKAYLTRKYRHHEQTQMKEVLTVSLNEQSNYQPYLLGRLFAVLEKAQMEAFGSNKPNATIKDRYFTSACATPATVFPILLRLSQHHISKAEYGYSIDNQIKEIMDHLDVDERPFPAHLSLDEQGVFILGYYHQRVAFYTPKNRDTTTAVSDTAN